MATRFTGRASMLFFGWMYVRSVKSSFEPSAFQWESAVFAGMHFLHLFYIVTYNQMKGGFPVNFKLAGGITAYAITGLLPFLASQMHHRRKLLSTGLHFVLLIFGLTYVSRIFIEPVENLYRISAWTGLIAAILLAVGRQILARRSD
jgi:hypothetical protein